jgi:predicted SAM-dependent methyltransferase
MEVLEIGANVKPQAQLIWKDAKVLTLDIDPNMKPDIVADAGNMPEELHGRFDGILASHVLEHFSYWREQDILKSWIACLKEGGELHIVVPSAEWAAREVLSENPSPALHGHMLAGQVNGWDVHLNIFTMRKLRSLFERVGLSVTRARTGEYWLHYNGKEYKAEQHYICGVKGKPELSKE